jgi:hypothetical protein
MKSILTIILLIVCGCATNQVDQTKFYNPNNIDQEVQPFVDDFILGLKKVNQLKDFDQVLAKLKVKLVKRVKDVSSDTVNLPDNNLRGRCYYSDNLVELDKAFWDWTPLDKRQYTIDHELGHCILKRSHRTMYDQQYAMGQSIMSQAADVSDVSDYNEVKDRLRVELFQKKRYGSLIILTELVEHQSPLFNKAFSESFGKYQYEINGDLPLSPPLKAFLDLYPRKKLDKLIYEKETRNENVSNLLH